MPITFEIVKSPPGLYPSPPLFRLNPPVPFFFFFFFFFRAVEQGDWWRRWRQGSSVFLLPFSHTQSQADKFRLLLLAVKSPLSVAPDWRQAVSGAPKLVVVAAEGGNLIHNEEYETEKKSTIWSSIQCADLKLNHQPKKKKNPSQE